MLVNNGVHYILGLLRRDCQVTFNLIRRTHLLLTTQIDVWKRLKRSTTTSYLLQLNTHIRQLTKYQAMGARRQGQTGSADPPWKSQLTLDMSALSAHLHWPLPVCIIARACCTAGSSHKLLISSAALALAALLRLAQRPGPAAIQARFY